MRKFYKIYQTNFDSDHPTDTEHFLKVDDQEYETLKEAEKALKLFIETKAEDFEEYTILPIYIKE